MRRSILMLTLLAAILLVACRAPTPTPSPIPTPTPQVTAEASPTATPSPTPAPEPTATPTPLPEPTPTPSPTPAPLYLEGWRSVPGTGALERAKPELADKIIALPWVSDGIAGTEREVVGQIVSAAMLDEQVFLAVVDRPWVLDGLNRTERNILQTLTRFSNQSVASLIPDIPFLATVEPSDLATLDRLSTLDRQEPGLLPVIAELSWVGDGIDGAEPDAIRWLRSFDDSDLALSVIGLGWVQDGIENGEVDAIEELSYLNTDGPGVAASVVGLSWVEDGIDDLEVEAIGWISNLGGGEAAESVVALQWVQDGIEETEVGAIEELSYVAYGDSGLASAVAGLGWMQDGVDELEFEALEWIGNFSNPEVASALVALEWAGDGVEEIEVRAIEELSYIDYGGRELSSAVVGLGWVGDGITDLELKAIGWIGNFSDAVVAALVVGSEWVQDGLDTEDTKALEELSYLSNRDRDAASNIVGMPFLETLEAADVSAIEALSSLAWFRETDFQRVMAHPTISGGITSDWAKIVATLYGVSRYNAPLIDMLLDPEQVTLEERTIELPLAGETHLAIIRTGPGAERSMDLLEHSVHHAEEYMATSFPTGYVGWLVGEAVTPTFGGNNFGTHITTLAKYDIDDGSNAASFAGHLLAHEVAHYYWSGNSNWVDEGAADFMASVSEYARIGTPIGVTNPPCGYVRSITELEALNISSEAGADSAFTCNYSLGERLLVDLYRNLGEGGFRQGLQELYLLSEEEQKEEAGEVGIEEIKVAFVSDEDAENHALDLVTKRWYDGTEPYDTSMQDNDPANRRFVTINGGIDLAYLAASSGGPPAMSFHAPSADYWVRLFLDYSYSVGSNTEVPLEIVTYFEDGFVFDREHVTFTAEPGFIGATWWLSVGVSPSERWAPGQYRVYVYNEGRKLVELEYEVTE